MIALQKLNAKHFLFVIIVGIPLLLFWNLQSVNVVSIKADYPKEIIAGTKIPVTITIQKGNISGFGRYTHVLPAGFTAESTSPNFEFEENTVKFLWINLPFASTFTFTYMVNVPANYTGTTFTVTGKFGYVVDNERRFVEVTPSNVIVKNDPVALRKILMDQAASKNAPVIIEDITCFRTVNVLKDHAIVSIRINKGNLAVMSKLEEMLPVGYMFYPIETEKATFTSNQNVARFLWTDLPEKDIFYVSYKVIPEVGYNINDLYINGAFSFIYNDKVNTIPVLEKDINAISENSNLPALETNLNPASNIVPFSSEIEAQEVATTPKNYSANAPYDIDGNAIGTNLQSTNTGTNNTVNLQSIPKPSTYFATTTTTPEGESEDEDAIEVVPTNPSYNPNMETKIAGGDASSTTTSSNINVYDFTNSSSIPNAQDNASEPQTVVTNDYSTSQSYSVNNKTQTTPATTNSTKTTTPATANNTANTTTGTTSLQYKNGNTTTPTTASTNPTTAKQNSVGTPNNATKPNNNGQTIASNQKSTATNNANQNTTSSNSSEEGDGFNSLDDLKTDEFANNINIPAPTIEETNNARPTQSTTITTPSGEIDMANLTTLNTENEDDEEKPKEAIIQAANLDVASQSTPGPKVIYQTGSIENKAIELVDNSKNGKPIDVAITTLQTKSNTPAAEQTKIAEAISKKSTENTNNNEVIGAKITEQTKSKKALQLQLPKKRIVSQENTLPKAPNINSLEGVSYKVQISARHKKIRTKYFNKFKIFDKVVVEKIAGWFKYSVFQFATYVEAKNQRNSIWENTTIKDAFVVAYNGKTRITVQEALMLTKQKWEK